MNKYLIGKYDFTNVIRLSILRWGDYSVLSKWSQHNHSFLKVEEEGRERVGNMTMEREGGEI